MELEQRPSKETVCVVCYEPWALGHRCKPTESKERDLTEYLGKDRDELRQIIGERDAEIERLKLQLQQSTLERDAMLEDIAALRMAERLNVETISNFQKRLVAAVRAGQPPAASRDAERYQWLRRRIARTIIQRIDMDDEDCRPEHLDELIDARLAPTKEQSLVAGCHRSHPHENMSAECEQLTVEARENNKRAHEKSALTTEEEAERDWQHAKDVFGASPTVPPGHFWRGEINRFYCKNCGKHYDAHLHTDEASTCPTVETPAAPEPPEKTWDCSICGRNNYVTESYCQKCDFSRMVMQNGQPVPRDGKR